MPENKNNINPVHIKEVIFDYLNNIEKAYGSGDFRLLQEESRRVSPYYELSDDLEESPTENPYIEEMKKAFEQERIEELKEILYQEYLENYTQKTKHEELIKQLEEDFFKKSEKKPPLYKFMESKSPEELAECFKIVYHYFASTYYTVDSYYPIEVKQILDMMIWSTQRDT